jgi:hypothetical protein
MTSLPGLRRGGFPLAAAPVLRAGRCLADMELTLPSPLRLKFVAATTSLLWRFMGPPDLA